MNTLRDFLVGFLYAAAVISLSLWVLSLTGCAQPVPPHCIPPSIMQECARGGGCTLLSQVALDELVAEAVSVGARSCKVGT